jgi:hypothetical protein
LIKILFAETLNLFLFNLLFINNNTAKGASSICLEKTFKFCETSLMDNMFWMATYANDCLILLEFKIADTTNLGLLRHRKSDQAAL